jgi:hypothetical protein
MRALQLTSIGGLQAGTVGLQAGTLPATTAAQIDISSIMNLMLVMVIMVMMMKMMGKATEAV